MARVVSWNRLAGLSHVILHTIGTFSLLVCISLVLLHQTKRQAVEVIDGSSTSKKSTPRTGGSDLFLVELEPLRRVEADWRPASSARKELLECKKGVIV